MKLTTAQQELLRVARQYGDLGVYIRDDDRDAQKLVRAGLCEWFERRLRSLIDAEPPIIRQEEKS